MATMTKVGQLDVDLEAINAFAEKHRLSEFSIFGSALCDDFRPESDVDVLFELIRDEPMTLEKYLDMKDELTLMFGRDAHITQRSLVTNPFSRYEILTTRRKLYVQPTA